MFHCPIDSYAFTQEHDLFAHLVTDHSEFTAHFFLFLSSGLMNALEKKLSQSVLERMPEEELVIV